MPRIVIFDIDNTLTESRSPVSSSMAELLTRLLTLVPVALISGGSLSDFEKQVISHLPHAKKENLYVLPTSGAELYAWKNESWEKIYSFPLSESKKHAILKGLAKVMGISTVALGHFVYDRNSQITFSALGKDASLEEKYAWDPTREKRREIVSFLQSHVHGVSMTIGGSSSIDFTEEGIDKAFGVKKLLEYTNLNPQDALFVGDALAPGGNDEPVKKIGVETKDITNPKETEEIINSLIRSLELH